MGKNFVIYGDTSFAEEMYKIISFEGRDIVIAFTNDRAFLNRREIDGIPVIPIDELANSMQKPFEVLLAFGYTQMNKLREKIYYECKVAGFIVGSYISTNAICYSNNIGEGTFIWPGVYIGPDVVIGTCNIIKAACEIAHNNVIGDFNYIAGSVVMGGLACIGNHCFIGLNSTLRDNIHLADYTLLGCGCNMLKNNDIVGGGYVGNPARMLKKRSLDIKI